MSHGLLVLGMHRSGTSALAGSLRVLGVDLGTHLMGPNTEDNPRGYFEHLDLVAAHDRFLESMGSCWDDPRPRLGRDWPSEKSASLEQQIRSILERDFSSTGMWAVKDPRMCRLLGPWTRVLEELDWPRACIMVGRDPDGVAASLYRRSSFSLDKSNLLWADHYLSADLATRGWQRAFVSFSSLLSDPVAALEDIGSQLQIDWPSEPVAKADELRRFIRPDLRSRPVPRDLDAESGTREIVQSIWEKAGVLSSGDSPAALQGMDEARQEFAAVADRAVESVSLEHLQQMILRLAREHAWTTKTETTNELLMVAAEVEDHSRELRHVGELANRTQAALADELERLGSRFEAVESDFEQMRRLVAEDLKPGERRLAERQDDHAAELERFHRRFSALEASLEQMRRLVAEDLKPGERRLAERQDDHAAELERLHRRFSALEASLEETRQALSALASTVVDPEPEW